MPKKKTMNEQNNLTSEVSANKNGRINIFIPIFVFGLIALVILYLNFHNNLRVKHIIERTANKVEVVKLEGSVSNSQNPVPQEDQNKEAIESMLPIQAEETRDLSNNKLPQIVVNEPVVKVANSSVNNVNCAINCGDMLNFVQDYYQFKDKLFTGENYTDALINLSLYKIHSEELQQNLNSLPGLLKNYHDSAYFKDTFKELIRSIYKNSKQYFVLDLRDYFFIRKVGSRAMDSEGLDKIVYLISISLDKNDFKTALTNLNIISTDIESIDLFRKEIADKLSLEDTMNTIEFLLLNKRGCEMVSK